MPMGIVSDEELAEELARLNKPNDRKDKESHHPTISIVEKPHRGRSEGDVNVPDSLRAIIGEESVIDGRKAALRLAADFGISPSSVSAYAKGATSTTTYDTPSKSIISHINKSRVRAIGKAQKTLNCALSAITQEKLDYSDAKDLSTIAKDMSVVIKNLEPPLAASTNDGQPGNQFVIFAPTFRQENSFETITVNE